MMNMWDEMKNIKAPDELKARTENDPEFRIFPMTLQMRPSWLDVSVG